MKRYLISAILLVAAGSTVVAAMPDEKDYDESVRLPVRKLHPEREFDKAMKKMHQEHEAKAQEKEAKEREKEAKAMAKEREKEAKARAKEEKKKAKHDNRVIPERRQASESTADKSLMRELLSKDYSIKKYENIYEEPKPITWKDDPVSSNVTGLMAHMSDVRKGGASLLTPRGVSMANDANDVFFCFEQNGGRASSRLRLRVQYYADDPLNYNDILFTIDGFNYEFHPSRPSRGKMGARMYWEQSDDVLTSRDKDLVYALSHCHWARMSLKGADGMNHVKMLTQSQLDAFAHAFELYRAMGGTF